MDIQNDLTPAQQIFVISPAKDYLSKVIMGLFICLHIYYLDYPILRCYLYLSMFYPLNFNKTRQFKLFIGRLTLHPRHCDSLIMKFGLTGLKFYFNSAEIINLLPE